MLTAEQIQKNWVKHCKILNHYLGSNTERMEKIKGMLQDLEENYVMAPASVKSWYHNAFPGGYVDHVNRVMEIALKQKDVFKSLGGTIDFSDEELIFAAAFHDLGKLGDGVSENYKPQTDKWRRDKLSEVYTFNPDLQFMLVQDRSLYVLQKFGIQMNQKEWLGIKLHDGVYDKSNESYFFSNMESSKLKTNLVHILHTADFLASKIEYDLWKNSGGKSTPKVKKEKTNTGKTVNGSKGLSDLLKNM